MSAEDYLAILRKKNPAIMKADVIKFKVLNFEKAIIEAFEAGKKAGKNEKSLFERAFGK